ncbi:ribose 5-phosphate isomerase B [Candidatus Woesearchaeota archaeon]|nr:ribose 5-phosphate isomerase B [Candidatus Woesearchaeota archaeon]
MIYLGADHAGFALKEELKKYLAKISPEEVVDVGSFDPHSTDDYPDYAKLVARQVQKSRKNKGILICGTGTGMVIAANKFKGIRAVCAYDAYTAKMSRLHNDANILCLRGRKFSTAKQKRVLKLWLSTSFSGHARHRRRIAKLSRL